MSESTMRQGGITAVVVAAVGGLAVGLAVGLLWSASQGTKEVGDTAAVRAVLEEQDQAWNAGDLDRFMQTYWDDDGLTFYSGGNVMKGRKAVHERYRKTYQAEGKEMGQLTISELEVTMLSAEVAQARGRWRVVTKKETLEGLFTLVLRRFADGWKIVHDHTSRAEKKDG
jgi:uncharacterized protein (TIGR02246 family)